MRRRALLFVIIGIAFWVRIVKVPTIPPSLSWDEVSIGYNAYSILVTGHDEHGRSYPLDTFIAYGDYKPPIPIYLTVPFIAIFGLTELAVRLPSVVAGTLTVLFTFFLAAQFFKNKPFTLDVSLIASLLLAISPWHIQLSRAGFEANIALFFVVLGAYIVLRARSRPSLLCVCFIPFVLAIYTFNSARYFVPMLGGGLIVYIWRDVLSHRKQLGIGLVIAFVLLLPLLPHLLSKEARLRFNEVNIFTDASIVQTANERMEVDQNSYVGRILHNRRIGYARSYLTHFFDHFEPWFLFIRGDGNPKFSLGEVGQLYVIEAPLLLIGIFFLFKREPKTAWLLIFWIIAAIIPAATARETPHALRIENSLPAWEIFIAFGVVSSIKYYVSRMRTVIKIALVLLYVGSFAYFYHHYFNHYSVEYSGEWQWGYREAIAYAGRVKGSYDEIEISEAIGRPYMYVLFYEKVDPRLFWNTKRASFDDAGFYNVFAFDTYRFVRSHTGDFRGGVLYILPPNEVPAHAHELLTIRQLNGQPVLVIFDI